MVPNNYTLLGEAARNNFDDAFGLDVLRIGPDSWTNTGSILHNDKYQFQFNHAFDGFDKYVSHHNRNNLLNEEKFKRHYHLIKDKFEHLTNNSRKAFSTTEKTIYMVYAATTHAKTAGQRHQDFINLLNIIKSKRNADFLLLILVTTELEKHNAYQFDTIIEENLVYHRIQQFNMQQWFSPRSYGQWDDILSALLLS